MVDDGIPFRLAGGRNPVIMLPVLVNDTGPHQFILDTGASHCLITTQLAAALDVETEREEDAMGAGGPILLAYGHVQSLALGHVRKEGCAVGITGELDRVASAIGDQVDGALGYDFLHDLVLSLDYDACRLHFAPPERSITTVPFRLAAPSTPLIVLSVLVNGDGPHPFALDTGASRTIVSVDLATRLGVGHAAAGQVVGGGGSASIARATLETLTVGDATVHAHEVGVATFLERIAETVGTPLDGIVGYNFLNQFRPTIDYPHATFALAPR